jgi:multidrug efflux pump subunit AcrA (membrane-fusion protein)
MSGGGQQTAVTDTGTGPGTPGRWRWLSQHPLAAGLLIGTLLLTSGAVAAWLTISGPGPTVLTARVERRALDGSVTAPGTVTAGQTVQLTPLLPQHGETLRAVVTKLPVSNGELLVAGRVLVEISGRPVFALPGQFPAYRDLKPGATGPDVLQLQRALRGLGFRTGTDKDGTFGAGTAAALTALYTAHGYTPLSAQSEGAALVAAAQDVVAAARRAGQDDRDALRTARAQATAARAVAKEYGSDAAKAERAAAEQAVREAQRRVARDGADLAAARSRLTAARTAAGPMLPAAEVLYLRGFPATVDSVTTTVGAVLTRSAMTLSADGLVVRSTVPGFLRGRLQPGQSVRILSDSGRVSTSGTVVSVDGPPATVRPVATGADAAGAGGRAAATAPAGYPLVVRPDHDLDPGLAARSVQVTVQAEPSQGRVLAVPTSALTVDRNGRTTVTVYRDGARHRTEVATGACGGGWTEIRPLAGEVREGERVVLERRPGSPGVTAGPSADDSADPSAGPSADPAGDPSAADFDPASAARPPTAPRPVRDRPATAGGPAA